MRCIELMLSDWIEREDKVKFIATDFMITLPLPCVN